MIRIFTASQLALLLLFAPFAPETVAQSYPSRPIRLIIAFPPGGSSDVVGRELAHHLGPALGTQLIIDNRSGANGLIGARALATARPDGYSLMLQILTSHITNYLLYRNPPYDLQRDFSSITLVGWTGLVFIANPSTPTQNMKALIALSRTSEDGINIGSFGRASLSHFSIQLLKSAGHANLVHVPYSGAGPAVTATLAGHVAVSVVGLPAALSYIRTGRLRPLAITGAKRSPQIPEVPTVTETGLPDFDAELMYGLLAPAHTPRNIVARVHQAAVKVLKSPYVQRRLRERGLDYVSASSPEEMDAYIKAETKKLSKLMESAGIVPQ